MARKKLSQTDLVRAVDSLPEYPAVFVPTEEGGFEVIFPNLAGVKAFGVNLDAALLAARESLTAEMTVLIRDGDQPPMPSDPARLIPDEDEPYGTRLVMVEPDRPVLRRRFKLVKTQRGLTLGMGRVARKKD